MTQNHPNVPSAGGAKRPRDRFAPQPQGRLHLMPRDRELACAVFLHRCLSSSHLVGLGFFASKVSANRRARILFDHRILRRYLLPIAPYTADAVYGIGAEGVGICSGELGLPESDIRGHSRSDIGRALLEHSLAVADIRVAFRSACLSRGWDMEWRAELECRHAYALRLADGWHKRVLRPDGFARLRTDGSDRTLSVFFEADMASEAEHQLTEKYARYQEYARAGLFESRYGTSEPFRVAVVTTTDARASRLIALAHREGHGNVLATTFRALAERGPLQAIWKEPGSAIPRALE